MAHLFDWNRRKCTAITVGGVLCLLASGPILSAESAAADVSTPKASADGASDSPGESGSGNQGSVVFAGRVVAAPGRQAEILVPSTGVVYYATEPPKNIGDRVSADEPLCVIEYRFNYHDSAHLYTQRWPLLKAFVDAKREMVETSLALEKSRYVYDVQAGSKKSPESGPELVSPNSVILLWALRDLQAAERQFAVARAEFEGSKTRLDRHDAQIGKTDLTRRPLMSPISGTIMEASFHQGQLVYEGSTIYRIVDLSRVWVRAEVFESEISTVQKAKKATAVTMAFPEETFTGRLVQVAPRVKEPGRTLEVFFEVPNPGEKLKIGMLAKVSIPEAGGN